MKYKFKDFPNGGQVGEGYTILTIVDNEVEANTPEEIALAEKYGGVVIVEEKPARPPKAKAEKEGE